MSWIFGVKPQKVEIPDVAPQPPSPPPLPLPPPEKSPTPNTFEKDLMVAKKVIAERDRELSRINNLAEEKNLKIRQLEAQIHESQRVAEEQRRNSIFERIKTGYTVSKSGVKEFVSNNKGFCTAVGGLTAFAAGWCIAKGRFSAAAKCLHPRLVQPSLIRETSRFSAVETFKHPFHTASQFVRLKEDPLINVQFSPYLESRFRDILNTTKNIQLKNGPFRNVHFFGPQNAGKKVLARSLAYYANLDFAIVNGRDIAARGKKGAAAINEVFDWAESSQKGLILYFDEADAFFNHCSTELLPTDRQEILNAFYFRTLTRSKKYMVVVASNQLEKFDWALYQRMDEFVELELPTGPEREKLLVHYFEHYILSPPQFSGLKPIEVENFNWKEMMNRIWHLIHGMSAHEILKLVLDWRRCGDQDGILTQKTIIERTKSLEVQIKVRGDAIKLRYGNVEYRNADKNVKIFGLNASNFIPFLQDSFLGIFGIVVIPGYVSLLPAIFG